MTVMKKLVIDVMVMGGVKFYRQLTYSYNPLFKIDLKDVEQFVYEKCPTLKCRKDVVLIMDNQSQKIFKVN